MSCTTQETKSDAERLGRAPNCWLASTLCLKAIHDMRFAISLSSPLPRTDSRAIGLYDLGEDISTFFGLAITARKHLG